MAFMQSTKVTPTEYAERLKLDVRKVLAWIHQGELKAVNVSSSLASRKPRFLISEEAIQEFENLRTTFVPQKRMKKPRRKHDPDFIEYVK
jgi:excisionase family DNA binding protein